MAGKKQRSPRRPTLLSVARMARKAGIEVARYEIEGGKITVVTSAGDSVGDTQRNPWDEVLKNGDGDHAPKQKRPA